ncbi:Stp1/IreP family PP2C-type Ser/Thr phosphatase [Fodinisporobacter ferrooxydans]|uniref:Stp1/IreP family PP2C-type Ser/Thr phosphatase n=1 Tax=Fodinisporobacter ferrooxydans TaxID=2901836 RepID=A0ABY4CFB5_9BACL|nr:Stp1/IreP family PP2C-type Ser/Thr phosphatase [Alicyclobacillaceae bacterium MYW30-H2]
MHALGRSHVGRVRAVNQDSYGIRVDGPQPHIVVADGMGGHNAGEVASKMAVDAVMEYMEKTRAENPEKPLSEWLLQSFEYANRTIFQHAASHPEQAGMGTTLIMTLFETDKFWIGHIGDSRGYLLHDGKLKQITQDHSLVQELVRNGQLSEEEAEHHPQRHILTRALGTDEQVQAEIQEGRWNTEDILVLCSDGLTIHVSAAEIETILYAEGSLDEKVDTLLELALTRGGHDNITIVAVENVVLQTERGDAK